MNKKSWEYRELISTGLRMLKVELSDEIIMRTLAVIELIDQKGKDVTLSDITGLKFTMVPWWSPKTLRQTEECDPLQSNGTGDNPDVRPTFTDGDSACAGIKFVPVNKDGSIDTENLPF